MKEMFTFGSQYFRVSSVDEDETMPDQSIKVKANEEAVKYLSAIGMFKVFWYLFSIVEGYGLL